MVGMGAAPLWLQRTMYASETTGQRKKILVAIFQRGAADGLNIVVPHGEKRYYELRPTLQIPQPSAVVDQGTVGHRSRRHVRLPSRPRAAQADLGRRPPRRHSRRRLARSHALPLRRPGLHGIRHARHEGHRRRLDESRAAAGRRVRNRRCAPSRSGSTLPRSLRGANDAVAIESLRSFQVRDANAAKIFESLYLATDDQVLNGTGKETFEAVSILKKVQSTPYTPANGANYPNGRFGDSLRQIAQLIKADVGVEVAFADYGGWDHHVQEMNALPNMLRDFGGSLAAFWNDLGDLRDDVVVVTMSEFGRTAKENGTRGTDHGHANVMFVMGGPVKGGKVYGKWPGLADHELYEKRDLAVTTDFRAVFGEVVHNHIGNKDIIKVFPGYQGGPQDFRGFLKV